jgi:hypothetical protein
LCAGWCGGTGWFDHVTHECGVDGIVGCVAARAPLLRLLPLLPLRLLHLLLMLLLKRLLPLAGCSPGDARDAFGQRGFVCGRGRVLLHALSARVNSVVSLVGAEARCLLAAVRDRLARRHGTAHGVSRVQESLWAAHEVFHRS